MADLHVENLLCIIVTVKWMTFKEISSTLCRKESVWKLTCGANSKIHSMSISVAVMLRICSAFFHFDHIKTNLL